MDSEKMSEFFDYVDSFFSDDDEKVSPNIDDMRTVLSDGFNNPENLDLLLAFGYYKSGNYSRSLELFNRVIQMKPKWSPALMLKKFLAEKITADTVFVESRYLRNFDEAILLGRGGFSRVVRCRHKFVQKNYAMKIVKLRGSVGDQSREVCILTRLHHNHVVRYYHAWYEHEDFSKGLPSVSKGLQTGSGGSKDETEKQETAKSVGESSQTGSGESKDETSKDETEETSKSVGESTQTRSSWSKDETETSKSVGEEEKPKSGGNSQPPNVPAYLYIQMEYCPGTLRQHLDKNYEVKEDFVRKVSRQILEGVRYIHQENIVHRDLTPSNIFFGDNDEIKIGDFGLAKEFGVHQIGDGDERSTVNSTKDGSPLYKAPERKEKGCVITSKVDIYSFGVILFELLYSFAEAKTESERAHVLTDLRKEEIILPTRVETEFPGLALVVRRVLSHDPSARPSAQQLLEDEFF